MHITDINGKQIEVTDLEKAINHSDAYRSYVPVDKHYPIIDGIPANEYWNDIYEKLLILKPN